MHCIAIHYMHLYYALICKLTAGCQVIVRFVRVCQQIHSERKTLFSLLILPQARFQKQQLTEKENRLLVRFENSRNFLLNRISGPPPASSTSTGSQSSSLSSSSSSWSQKSRYGDTKCFKDYMIRKQSSPRICHSIVIFYSIQIIHI